MSKKVIKTVARQASEQIQAETKNASFLQGPFATKNYHMDSVRLETTLSEIDLLAGTPAIVRTGFEQDDNKREITIPTIFAKVDGIPTDEKKYWKNLDSIRDSEGLKALVSVHFYTGDWYLSDEEYAEIMKDFTVTGLKQSTAWAYKMLNEQLQNEIAESIIEMFEDWAFSIEATENIKQEFLSVALDLPKDILDMNLEVDYPKDVPLLAFIHQEDIGELNRQDVVALNMFHYLGWDVILYSPHGFASLENYMEPDTFDKFSYDKMRSTESAKGDHKKSFFSKLFN